MPLSFLCEIRIYNSYNYKMTETLCYVPGTFVVVPGTFVVVLGTLEKVPLSFLCEVRIYNLYNFTDMFQCFNNREESRFHRHFQLSQDPLDY